MNDDAKKKCAVLIRTCELNKAACYLKFGDDTNALATCNTVLKDDPCNTKAFFRRAKAQYGLREYVEAIRDLKRTLELDPENSEAKTLLPHCKKAQKIADKESSVTFAKMMKGLGKINFAHKDAEVEKPVEPETPEEAEEEEEEKDEKAAEPGIPEEAVAS